MGQCVNLTRFFTELPHPSRQDIRVYTAASESGLDFTIKRISRNGWRHSLRACGAGYPIASQEKSRGT
jgi:hypothetical protein